MTLQTGNRCIRVARGYAAPPGPNAAARLAYWSEQVWRTIAIDHTPPPAGPSAYFEQAGPTRSSRVLAIFHIAIYDALNAIRRRYPGYSDSLPAFADSSPDAAIAQAAHDTLAALYPHQATRLGADLARLPGGRNKLNGIDIGRRAAAAILALRANDGSQRPEPAVGEDYPLYTEPGKWRPDPVSGLQVAFGAWWGYVKPFVLPSVSAFRPPPPLASDAYTRAFYEVKQLGGNGRATRRTHEQTRIGIFWGHDGTTWIGTPLNVYNQIAVQIIRTRAADPLEQARVLALFNAGLADSIIVCWEAKYYYRYWRPVHGIREANAGWIRPRWPRSFSSFSQAEEEAGQSRIYLGVHWQFDKTAGIAMGRQVADYVFKRGLVRPQP